MVVLRFTTSFVFLIRIFLHGSTRRKRHKADDAQLPRTVSNSLAQDGTCIHVWRPEVGPMTSIGMQATEPAGVPPHPPRREDKELSTTSAVVVHV